MSDFPQGPGWWQASDDKWYAPELHPDYQPNAQSNAQSNAESAAESNSQSSAPSSGPTSASSADSRPGSSSPRPDISEFEPPVADQRVGFPGPGIGPAAAPSPDISGTGVSGPPPVGQPVLYPGVPAKKRSTGKVLAIVFGVLFLLLVAGCGAFVFAFRDEIADGGIDFTDGVEAGDDTQASASCEATGLRFGSSYGVAASLNSVDESVTSHFEMSFELRGPDDELLGTGTNVFRDMEPGELRSEDVFPTITATVPFDTTTCTVTELIRVAA